MKRAFPILLLLVFLLQGLISFAQNSSINKQQVDSLSYRNPFFALYPRVVMNGHDINGKDAMQVLGKVPDALQAYRMSRKQYKIGWWSLAGSFAGLTLSAISFDQGNRPLTGTGLLLSIGGLVNYVVFLSAGESNFKKAIRPFNASQ